MSKTKKKQSPHPPFDKGGVGGISLLLMLLTSTILDLFSLTCGRSGPPVPPETIVPEAVKDLRSMAMYDGIMLFWSPPKKTTGDDPLKNLAGFVVLRSSRHFDEIDCWECEEEFLVLDQVEYKIPEGGPVRGEKIFYIDNNIQVKNRYRYRIVPYNARNNFGMNSDIVRIFWDSPPDMPINVKATGENQVVNLEWTAPNTSINGEKIENIAGYNIYRRFEGESFSLFPINPGLVTLTTYIDTGLTNEQVYFYQIRAVRRVESTLIEGKGSLEIKISPMDVIPPQPPQGLVVVAVENGISLRWSKNVEPDIGGYNIFRRSSQEETRKKINTTLIDKDYYLDASAEQYKTYYYSITAVDNSSRQNESKFSKEVMIRYER